MAEPRRRWDSRSLGSRFAHGIFYAAIRLGGRWPAYAMLCFVVAFYTCLPKVRARSAPYRGLRFGPSGWTATWLRCYALHMNFALTLVDRAVLGIRNDFDMQSKPGHPDILRNLAARGRGLIVLTAHVGCWQLGLSALGDVDAPKAVVMLRDEADVDRQYFEHRSGERPDFCVIDPRGPLGGMLEMLDLLRRGGVVCMMGDRDFGGARSQVAVPLLGRQAWLPASAYHLASASGAPVAVVLSRRTGPGRGLIWVAETLDVPPGLGRDTGAYAPYARRFASALSDFAQCWPSQFFNFFDLWTEPR